MAQCWLHLAALGLLMGLLGSPPRPTSNSRQAFPSSELPIAPQAGPAVQTILVFPFENRSRAPSLEWLSEGLAELSVERLKSGSRFVFSREDRLDALERMGLPSSAQFSVATMIEIGRQIGADDIVFGAFDSDGKTISITARALRLAAPELSPPLSAAGPLSNVLPLQAQLAGSIVCALDSGACPGGAPPADVTDPNRPPTKAGAFQIYIRAVTGPGDDQRLSDLRDAARLEPDWDLPAFEMGLEEYERRDCEAALVWLSRVPPNRPHGVEASFDAGVCHLLENDANRAESSFEAVLDRASPEAALPPVAAGASAAPDPRAMAPALDFSEARNDLGVALLRLGKIGDAVAQFQRAAQSAPDAPDFLFNLGIAQFLAGDAADGEADLRRAQTLAPSDAGIRGAVEQMAAQTQAAAAAPASAPSRAAGRKPPSPSASGASSVGAPWVAKARIAMRFDRSRLRPGGPVNAAAANQQSARDAGAIALHIQRGRQFLDAGDLDDAQRAFTEALLMAPYDAAAHRGLAEVFQSEGRPEDALRELGEAVSNLNDAPTHIQMAQLLIEMNRPADARDQLRQALALDPSNAQARQLLEKVQGSAGTGGTP
jgi:tetratricopeptide (TPR) repeat protein/TolB-like protein